MGTTFKIPHSLCLVHRSSKSKGSGTGEIGIEFPHVWSWFLPFPVSSPPLPGWGITIYGWGGALPWNYRLYVYFKGKYGKLVFISIPTLIHQTKD